MTKWVYAFGDGKAEGKADMRNLLGGKGANLAEMSNLGLPVPPGLTITTEVCTYYYANKQSYPPELKDQLGSALRGPVDAFFEAVKVNADDKQVRENRLNLLASLRATLHQVADFSKIEG